MPREPPEPVRVPVRSEVLAPGSFQARATLLGKVVPSSQVELQASTRGRVRYPSRFATGLRTGERVGVGELLFELDNEEVKLQLEEARLLLRAAEAELARGRAGAEAGFFSQAELRKREIEAELAEKHLANAKYQNQRLRGFSPVSGYLFVDRSFPPGAELNAGTTLAQVAGDGAPRVEAWAAATHLERLRPGLKVLCQLSGSDREDPIVGLGRLRELARHVDESGAVRVMIDVDEDLGLPPPGEGLELSVLLQASEALSLPEEALVVSSGATSVFVLESSGESYTAERRMVRTGMRGDGRIEVLAGVREGERVAVSGVEFLSEGALAVDAGSEAKR